jgi:ATP-dependent DNA helicase RecG
MERLSIIPIRFIKGVGPKRAETFARNGISSVEDLVLYFPRRYDDRTHFATISQRQEGASITIKARVVTSDSRRSFRRRGFSITRAIVEDATGRLECVWFNQPYMQEYLKPGSELILHGRIDTYSGRFQMNNPEFEAVSDSDGEGSLNIGRIVPIYTLPSGVGQRTLRAMIKSALDAYLDKAEDILPDGIRERHNLMPFAQSIRNIHFPDDRGSHLEAYSRLAFEEFLLFQLPLAVRKLRKRDQPGISHKIHGPVVARYVKALPFELTEAQKLVLMEISADMARPRAMQRLLQGDVGSGKTVVATVAAMMAVQGGYQAALMVPTEYWRNSILKRSVLNCRFSAVRQPLDGPWPACRRP